MNLDQQLDEATRFLDFYIRGSRSEHEPHFPDAGEPGIRHRTPAVRGMRPEYEPLPINLADFTRADANGIFAPGAGPEPSSEPYKFLDRCGLELAKVSLAGNALSIRFIFVTRYPPRQFPGMLTETSVIRLPFSNGAALSIATECIHQLEEHLGADEETSPRFEFNIEELELEDFRRRRQNGDL